VLVSGPGLLDVSIWQQAGSLTLHLVNLTNPMTMRGPYRELFPIGEQKIQVRLPPGLHARQVRLLKSPFVPGWYEQDGWVRLSVPGVLDHEVVAVDF
jgi:hypothetical protein